MKTKMNFLIKQSLKKKIDTKWFKAANIIILILLIGIINIDRIISAFGGDFAESTKIYVVDNIGVYENFKINYESMANSLEDFGKFEIKNTDKTIKDLKKDIKEKKDFIIEIKSSETSYIEANIISYNTLDMLTNQLISSSLGNVKSAYVLQTSGLTEQQINGITAPVEITNEYTNPELDPNAEAKDLLSGGLIIILIIPFFILITLLTQMIGAEINDEKSTRSMEIIISNVSPKVHFISKIISSTIFVILQSLLILLYGFIAMFIRKILTATGGVNQDVASYIGDILKMVKNTGILDLLLKGLPIIIILFILSFLIYAILAGILASMTTNIEDYQQLQSPLMIILMVGYYIAIMASTFDGSLFVKITSYIPMLSFLIAPVIYLLGQISLIELTISTAICGVTVYILFHFGLRIYKVGILNYSSTDLWKKIFKSLKEKE